MIFFNKRTPRKEGQAGGPSDLLMCDEESMPTSDERLRDLLDYARLKYTGRDVRELCAAIVEATPPFSLRGYCTWGVRQERAALDAAVANAALVPH